MNKPTPYENLVTFINRHHITPKNEKELWTIVKQIVDFETELREREAFEAGWKQRREYDESGRYCTTIEKQFETFKNR